MISLDTCIVYMVLYKKYMFGCGPDLSVCDLKKIRGHTLHMKINKTADGTEGF